jgi:hypothetical protein
MQFHASSFVMLGTVCAASVIVIFIGSVLELEMDVWNTYLMATATIIWPIVLRGLFNVVKIDELLDVRLQRYLRHQRRLNEKILRLGEKHHSSEDAVKLRRVCEEVNSLIEEIQGKRAKMKSCDKDIHMTSTHFEQHINPPLVSQIPIKRSNCLGKYL